MIFLVETKLSSLVHLSLKSISGMLWADFAEQAMALVADSGREIKDVRIPGLGAVPERQAPESLDREQPPGRLAHLPQKGPGRQIERVDQAVAEIPHQQRVAEFAEVRRRDRHSPGRVQRPLRSQTPHQITVEVEHIHVAVS